MPAVQEAYPAPPVVASRAEDDTHQATPDVATAAGAAGRMDLADVELATLLSIEYAVQGNLLSSSTRDDFVAWLALLAAAHPVASCAAGAAALADALPDVWPPHQDGPPSLARFRPCGVDRPRPGGWGACAGSTPDTRGYSCGLWVRTPRAPNFGSTRWESCPIFFLFRATTDTHTPCVSPPCRRCSMRWQHAWSPATGVPCGSPACALSWHVRRLMLRACGVCM